jgi:hypothetical protein
MSIFIDLRFFLFLGLLSILFSCSTEKFAQRKYLDGRFKDNVLHAGSSKKQMPLTSEFTTSKDNSDNLEIVSEVVETTKESSTLLVKAEKVASKQSTTNIEVFNEPLSLLAPAFTPDLEKVYREVKKMKPVSTKEFYWVNILELLSFLFIVGGVVLFLLKDLRWIPAILIALALYVIVRIINLIEHSN